MKTGKNNIRDTISLIFTVLFMGGWFILLLILSVVEYVYGFFGKKCCRNKKVNMADMCNRCIEKMRK